VADQLRNPLGVFHIGLAARHVLDVVGVAHDQVEVPLQHGVNRLPVNTRAFHADVSDAMLGEPRPQRFQLARGCAEAAQQLLRSAPWRADQNATDNASLVHVQTRTSFEDSFHRHHLS